MNVLRWMLGLPLAAAITAGLFLMMSDLIKRDANIGVPPPTPDVTVTAKLKQTDPPKPWRREPLPDAPDDPEVDPYRVPPGGGGPIIDITPDPIGPGEIIVGRRIGGTTIQLAPQYPDACRSKGIEGVVIVEFDITDRGETTNVRILSSPDRCFDRDVIRAVRGWRYPAEARRGVTEAINFQFVE